MNQDVMNEIKLCFWHGEPQKAVSVLEAHLAEIDFDDDDDAAALIGIVKDSFSQGNDTSLLEYLVSKGFDINFKLPKKDCLLLQCADLCVSPALFQKLAALGADVYSERANGENALSLSAKRTFSSGFGSEKSRQEDLPVFLTENYDLSQLDKADPYGITPLLYAVETDKPRLVDALLAHGADVNGTGTTPTGNAGTWISHNGVTALAAACREGRVEIAEKLFAAGADETIRDAEGNPPIFSLVRYPFNFLQGSYYASPLFQKKCAIIPMFHDLNATGKGGYTVLMEALKNQREVYANLPIITALIEQGADVNIAGNDGKRALHMAAFFRLTDTVKALVKAGAELDAQDNEGNTALLLSCKGGDEKTARYLLRAGANGAIQNNAGQSPADIAAEKGLSDVLELLL